MTHPSLSSSQGIHVCRITLQEPLKPVIAAVVDAAHAYHGANTVAWESVFINVCKHGSSVAGDVAALVFPSAPSPTLLRFPRTDDPTAKKEFETIALGARVKMSIPNVTTGQPWFTKFVDALESIVEGTASASVRVPLEPAVVGWSAAADGSDVDAASSIVLLSAQFGAAAFAKLVEELAVLLPRTGGKSPDVFAFIRVLARTVLAGNAFLTCLQEETAALRCAVAAPLPTLATQLLMSLTPYKGHTGLLLVRIYLAVFERARAERSRCETSQSTCTCTEQYRVLGKFIDAIRRGGTRASNKVAIEAAIAQQTASTATMASARGGQPGDDIFTFRDDAPPTSTTPILSSILKSPPRTLENVDAALGVVERSIATTRNAVFNASFLLRDFVVYDRMRVRHQESLDDWTAGCSRAVDWGCVCSRRCLEITGALKDAARVALTI